MEQIKSIFLSTIGRKYVVAITGLCLGLFIVVHLLGNFLLFLGPKAFNTYSHFLISNPFIVEAEIGLLLIFIIHITFVSWLTFENWRARPNGYAVMPRGTKAAPISSRTMIYHGSIIFVFLTYHLLTLKWGPQYTVEENGIIMRDLYRTVVESFSQTPVMVWYVFSMITLYFHLSHGASSLFQSLGLNNKSLEKIIEEFGYIYATVVAGGFLVLPIYIFFFAK